MAAEARKKKLKEKKAHQQNKREVTNNGDAPVNPTAEDDRPLGTVVSTTGNTEGAQAAKVFEAKNTGDGPVVAPAVDAKQPAAVKQGCHACETLPTLQFPLQQCKVCEFRFCPAKPCFYPQQVQCKQCAPKLLTEVVLCKDQTKFWTHTGGAEGEFGRESY